MRAGGCPRFRIESVPWEKDLRKSRFSEEQIINVLKEHAAEMSAGELCRKYGISDATFYKWRSRFGGMEVSDARKLKALEDIESRCTGRVARRRLWAFRSRPSASTFATSAAHQTRLPLRVTATAPLP